MPRKKAANVAKKPSARASSRRLKNEVTTSPVAPFLASLDDETRSACAQLDAWMEQATGSPGVMYGKAIAGYGTKTIQYAGGREAPWLKLGFSPRKNALTLYGVLGAAPASLLKKLGKHSTGKGCLYIKRLGDVDARVLKKLIETAAKA